MAGKRPIRLSFADEEEEEELPVKRERRIGLKQAPPIAFDDLDKKHTISSNSFASSYSKEAIEELKAKQKFLVAPVIEVVDSSSTEVVELSGDAAIEATEKLLESTKENSTGDSLHFYTEQLNKQKPLLNSSVEKKKGRVYFSANDSVIGKESGELVSQEFVSDLRDSDPYHKEEVSWEDELFKRGAGISKHELQESVQTIARSLTAEKNKKATDVLDNSKRSDVFHSLAEISLTLDSASDKLSASVSEMERNLEQAQVEIVSSRERESRASQSKSDSGATLQELDACRRHFALVVGMLRDKSDLLEQLFAQAKRLSSESAETIRARRRQGRVAARADAVEDEEDVASASLSSFEASVASVFSDAAEELASMEATLSTAAALRRSLPRHYANAYLPASLCQIIRPFVLVDLCESLLNDSAYTLSSRNWYGKLFDYIVAGDKSRAETGGDTTEGGANTTSSEGSADQHIMTEMLKTVSEFAGQITAAGLEFRVC